MMLLLAASRRTKLLYAKSHETPLYTSCLRRRWRMLFLVLDRPFRRKLRAGNAPDGEFRFTRCPAFGKSI